MSLEKVAADVFDESLIDAKDYLALPDQVKRPVNGGVRESTPNTNPENRFDLEPRSM